MSASTTGGVAEQSPLTVWGFPIPTVYQSVLQFYRRDKPQVHLEYKQRIELLALFKQVKLGPYTPDKDTDTGYFDVVGADRRKAWKGLGDMSKEEAQAGIIQLLEGVCPELNSTIVKELKEASQTIRKLDGEGGTESPARNRANTDSESAAVSSGKGQSPTSAPGSTPSNHKDHSLVPPTPGSAPGNHACVSDVPPATLWYSPNSAKHFISEFGKISSASSSCAPLALAAGETVCVQVPTSSHASALFWEVVTAHGNVGFGLSFQRGGGGEGGMEGGKFEILLPLTLRDCSNDLLLGSHPYKERGIYLLEFSNSHSRTPQVVYYRVFYQNSSNN